MTGPPVAIGGVGGSGTRVVAHILMRQGIDLGQTLNHAFDNLTFTHHFKKSDWFKVFPNEKDLISAWSSFLDDREITHPETIFQPTRSGTVEWGWKEPNTHIFLEFLSNYISGFKYIHVLRNGLDMAFSKNQQQMKNWSKLILGEDFSSVYTPSISLDYWIASNTRAVEIGQRMGKNFLLVKYEELCNQPALEIERVLSFVGKEGNLDELVGLVAPTSIGRHQREDLSIFSDAQIKSVERLMHVTL